MSDAYTYSHSSDDFEEKRLQQPRSHRDFESERTVRIKELEFDVNSSPRSRTISEDQSSVETGSSWEVWVSRTNRWKASFAASGPNRHWKPLTLRWPVLGFAICFVAVLLLGLEFLARKSQSDGGILFATTINDFGLIQVFLTQYLPTILAVFLSMMWSWIDLDIKRLEPWFQMSQLDGAMAADSILLQYTFDFLAMVPFRAARRRHWVVMSGGVVMMSIFWVITPLLGAVFSTNTIMLSQATPMLLSTGLLSIKDQNNALGTSIINAAYAYTWLGQSLPSYMTNDFALMSFKPSVAESSPSVNEIWQASTQIYFSDSSCWPATVSQSEGVYYTFSDGRGCELSKVALPEAVDSSQLWTVLSVAFYPSIRSNYFLQDQCPDASSSEMLYIWANGSGNQDAATQINGGLTAIFCDVKYFKQPVLATVRAGDLTVLNLDLLGDRIELEDSEFNTTNFESVISMGVSAVASKNFTDTLVPDPRSRLTSKSLVQPTTLEASFAVGATDLDLSTFGNASVLESAFKTTRQMLFSLAINKVMAGFETPTTGRNSLGNVSRSVGAVTTNRPISIAVEAVLGLVLILTIVIWVISYRRKSNLLSDPAAISNVMSVASSSPQLLHILKDRDTYIDQELVNFLGSSRFSLVAAYSGRTPTVRILHTGKLNFQLKSRGLAHEEKMLRETFKPVRPVEFHRAIGLIFIATIGFTIAILVTLWVRSNNSNGIALPSSNPVVRQIVENYLPTMAATFMEPFWVVINRLLCILQPFEELRRRPARSLLSLEAKYTSLPPQLAIWRALRSKHFLLAAVCAMAILANALAITLSGLLNEGLTNQEIVIQASNLLSPMFLSNDTGIPGVRGPPITTSDEFYVSLANISTNTPLPPWTDAKFFYSPVEINMSQSLVGNFSQVNLQTTGYGIEASCTKMDTQSYDKLTFSTSDGGESLNFAVDRITQNGTKIRCVDHIQANGHFANSSLDDSTIYPTMPSGSNLALEVVSTFQNIVQNFGTTPEDLFCSGILVTGWARLKKPSNTSTAIPSLTSSFLACTPTLRAALFNITVSSTGEVLSSIQSSPFLPISSIIPPADTLSLYSRLNHIVAFSSLSFVTSSLNFAWHNATQSLDQLNALLSLSLPSGLSSSFLSPTSPPPDPLLLAPYISDIYARKAAIIFSQNQHAFGAATPGSTTTITLSTPVTKIFISAPMFYATLVLLALNLGTAIAVYVRRPEKFLPRMPTTIASVVAFVAASRAVGDFDDTRGGTVRRDWPLMDLPKEGQRYGYGRFKGTDGRMKLGIERAESVIPLESWPSDESQRGWLQEIRLLTGRSPREVWI